MKHVTPTSTATPLASTATTKAESLSATCKTRDASTGAKAGGSSRHRSHSHGACSISSWHFHVSFSKTFLKFGIEWIQSTL
jgi:hypothetical protein